MASASNKAMRKGSYRRKVDFNAFRAKKFIAHISGGPFALDVGCGGCALATLIGLDPAKMQRRGDWTPSFMLSTLKSHGFKTVALTKRNLTNVCRVGWPVTSLHVVLARIKMIKHEASWVIIHNRTLYHLFEIKPLNGYELLNHPIMDAYLVHHKKWGLDKNWGQSVLTLLRAKGVRTEGISL